MEPSRPTTFVVVDSRPESVVSAVVEFFLAYSTGDILCTDLSGDLIGDGRCGPTPLYISSKGGTGELAGEMFVYFVLELPKPMWLSLVNNFKAVGFTDTGGGRPEGVLGTLSPEPNSS